MIIIPSMMFSGSIVMLLYFLLRPLLIKKCSVKSRHWLLMPAIVFYILPLQVGKAFYIPRHYGMGGGYGGTGFDLSVNVIERYPSGLTDFHISPVNLILFVSILLGAALLFCGGMVLYDMEKKHILQESRPLTDAIRIAELESIKGQLGIRKRVNYRISDTIKEPMTIGGFCPIYLLPSGQFLPEESRYIVLHEMMHIKNEDAFMKGITFLAVCLNWYNPLVYYLMKEMNQLSEIICDEAVVCSLGKSERIQYGNLILQMACKGKTDTTVFAQAFTDHGKGMEERIRHILDETKKKDSRVLTACLILLLSLSTFFFTASIYQYPTVITIESIPEKSWQNR